MFDKCGLPVEGPQARSPHPAGLPFHPIIVIVLAGKPHFIADKKQELAL
jgi:hypothetical protein